MKPRVMIAADLGYIQGIRFVMQLADYTHVSLPRSRRSVRLLATFPSLADGLALADRNETFEPVTLDHHRHRIRFRGVVVQGPSIPRRLLGRLASLTGDKTRDCCFIGSPECNRRAQLKGYEDHCTFVERETVNRFWDGRYWETLCRSRFALCPHGDKPWLYRVYEAILARAIPVLTRQQHVRMPGHDRQFHFYLLGHEKEYREDWTRENYTRLLEFNRRSWQPLLEVLR